MGCALQWMEHLSVLHHTFIALEGERVAPTNFQPRGYFGVARTRQQKNNCGMPVRLSSRIPRVQPGKHFFFLSANCEAQILMAICKNWKPKAPQASVCWVYGRSRPVEENRWLEHCTMQPSVITHVGYDPLCGGRSKLLHSCPYIPIGYLN